MNGLAILEKGVWYPIVEGSSAGELGFAIVRERPQTFVLELPSGQQVPLTCDITHMSKQQLLSSGLFRVGMRGRIVDDHSQRFRGTYNSHKHTGRLQLI